MWNKWALTLKHLPPDNGGSKERVLVVGVCDVYSDVCLCTELGLTLVHRYHLVEESDTHNISQTSLFGLHVLMFRYIDSGPPLPPGIRQKIKLTIVFLLPSVISIVESGLLLIVECRAGWLYISLAYIWHRKYNYQFLCDFKILIQNVVCMSIHTPILQNDLNQIVWIKAN